MDGDATLAPLIWMLGKTGAGKSAIAATLAGAPASAVGDGIAAGTTRMNVYAVPAAHPVLRFLDTPGLESGDRNDDPAALDHPMREAAMILVALRADDQAPGRVLELVCAARRARPRIPVIVAQTRLHDLYDSGQDHPKGYPFTGTDRDATLDTVPVRLRQALLAQRALFERVPGQPLHFVPVDLTRPDDGYEPADFGAEALWQALRDAAPGIAAALGASNIEGLRRAVILPWASAAAAAEAVPLPVLGGLGAAGLQAAMVRAIARRHGLAGGRALWAEFVAALGARFALGYGGRLLVRQGLKLAPFWGSAAAGAWSFAVTWGLGEAALAYCAARAEGNAPDSKALAAAYRAGLDRARDQWRGGS
jgi:uncharacterized protein (DUF697 family)